MSEEEPTIGELCGEAALAQLLPALSSFWNLDVTAQLQDGHTQTNQQHIHEVNTEETLNQL